MYRLLPDGAHCMTGTVDITGLVNAWRRGDQSALDELAPVVYDELKRLARRQMHGESPGHTLQATALVNEAFLRLGKIRLDYEDRRHFLAMAARSMRNILVDHARRRNSQKRGGDRISVPLDHVDVPATEKPVSVLDLDRALEELEENQPELASAVELIYFGGLTYDEAADALGVSRTKFYETMRFGKAWLRLRLVGTEHPQQP